MLPISKGQVNMDGSDDPFYRYQMPALLVKFEGTSKMKKSVLVNLPDVSGKIGRPADHLLTYLGQSLNAGCKIEKGTGKAYVTGFHSEAVLQSYVLKFIQETVMCHHCRNPETSCVLEGKKKSRVLYLSCKSCGERSDLDSSNRFVKVMINHWSHEPDHQPVDPVDDATKEPIDPIKRACPKCGHKTSKNECRKCGASLVAEKAPSPDDEVDLTTSVGDWMEKQDTVSSSSAEDLRQWLLSQGHINANIVETMSTVVQIAIKEPSISCDLEADKLKPTEVALNVRPTLQKWNPLVQHLHEQVGDDAKATEALVCAVQAFKDVPMIGILMCLRELVDGIEDTDLALACRSLRSHNLDKFIKWLEEDEPESDA